MVKQKGGKVWSFFARGYFQYKLLPPEPAQGKQVVGKITSHNSRLERQPNPPPPNGITAPVLTVVCLTCLQRSPVMETTLHPGNLFLSYLFP